jgi:diketogulonate reductase-like aldo/keto reductase
MQNFIVLNNGQQMPKIGLGTWRSLTGTGKKAVKYAIEKVGYRHIDCARIYENQKELGEAFSEVFSSGEIKRSEVFITSKLWCTDHYSENVEKACRQTLADLKLEYLDLYLIHWGIAFEHGDDLEPMGSDGVIKTATISTQETWQAMEKLVEKGLVKAIGVANFTTAMLIDLLSYAKIKPVVNQIEIHPYNSQPELISFCQKNGIVVTAYSPLGSAGNLDSKPLSDKVVVEIAKTHGKSPAQILIRWSMQRGLAAIPKSIKESRIVENFNIVDFELTDEEMDRINQLNKNHRFVNPIKWWGVPYFS